MTVQQFSMSDSQDIPQTQPATRRFLVISVICFVIAFICICTVAGVVFSNTGEGSQPRVDTSYGDLNSKTSLRSSSSFEIQPSTSLATSLTAEIKSTPILFSTTALSTLQSTADSELSGASSLVATMYPSATMIPVTSSLLQMLSSVVSSSSEISLISHSSPIYQTSVRDFSSDVLSSFHSSVLSTGLPNATMGPLITLPACPDSKFTCRSGECINLSARCNRYQDCQDKSDEENCLNCVGVQCDSGLCLWSWSPLCDAVVDCPDLSDEVNCASDSKIQCENGVWINKNQWCNGIDNCYDNSDERNCSCLAGLETECGDGRCIRSDWVCDGYQDCSTDETGCGSGCDRNQFVCEDYSCINQSSVCDGSLDCPRGEEESQCCNNSDLSGILLGHYRGDNSIYPLCSTNWNAYISDLVCRNMGHQGAAVTLTSGMYDAKQYLELSDNQTDTQTILSKLQKSFSCRTNRTVELACMPKECGKKSSGLLVPFISGGDLATRGSWPWVVSVSYLGKPICSGVLISPVWVLTAGHCMAVSGVYNYTHTPNYIQVLLGSVKRSRDLENGALLLRAVKILHHSDMKWTGEGTIYWDIALIKLERPVTFSSLIQPVCLSSAEDVPVTSTCFLTGWGSIEPSHDTTVEYLREAKLRVWDEEDCRRNTILSESSVNTNFTLCAGYTIGTLSGCRGDSGSGLACVNQHRQWSVVGVMSSGAAQCGVPSSQALRFTKVTSSMTWIQQIMTLYG